MDIHAFAIVNAPTCITFLNYPDVQGKIIDREYVVSWVIWHSSRSDCDVFALVEALIRNGCPITTAAVVNSLFVPGMTELLLRYGAEICDVDHVFSEQAKQTYEFGAFNTSKDRCALLCCILAWEGVPENVGRMIAELTQF